MRISLLYAFGLFMMNSSLYGSDKISDKIENRYKQKIEKSEKGYQKRLAELETARILLQGFALLRERLPKMQLPEDPLVQAYKKEKELFFITVEPLGRAVGANHSDPELGCLYGEREYCEKYFALIEKMNQMRREYEQNAAKIEWAQDYNNCNKHEKMKEAMKGISQNFGLGGTRLEKECLREGHNVSTTCESILNILQVANESHKHYYDDKGSQ